MRAGRLDRTIKIQRSQYIVDEAGNPKYTWSTIATVRAELVQASTEEFMRAYGVTDETAVIFRIRYIANLTTADRIVYDGENHNIREIKEIRRRRGLEIRTLTVAGT